MIITLITCLVTCMITKLTRLTCGGFATPHPSTKTGASHRTNEVVVDFTAEDHSSPRIVGISADTDLWRQAT